MMKRIALLILYLSIGLAATSYAEKLPHVSYYRAADGLSSRSVNCISQDEAGFIWIGSENGLDRFDGHHFKHYDIADGRTIYTIYLDNQGKLWLGTGKGVFIFNTENGLSEKFNVETKWAVSVCSKATIISKVCNKIFIGTAGQGFFLYNPENEELEQFCQYASMISAMSVYKDSLMYVGSEESTISEFKTDGQYVRNIAFTPQDYDVRMSSIQFLYADNEKIWAILQNKGLCSIPRDNVSASGNVSMDKSRQFHEARLSIPDTTGRFLVGCQSEIKRYDLKNRKAETVISGMASSPRCMFKDKNGGLWIGIEDDGIAYCPLKASSFEHRFAGKNITALAKDKGGNIWAGTVSGELFRIDSHGETTSLAIPEISSIQCLMADSRELWIGTRYDGLFIHNLDNGKTTNHRYDRYKDSSISDNCVTALFKDSAGKIYVGTEWGLSYYSRETGGFIPEPRASNHSSVTGFFEDSKKNIWILSSNDGLYRTTLDGKIWKDFNISKTNSLTSNTTYDMVEDNKGLIWVATASGLVTYSYERNTFSPVNQEFASGSISSLEKDSYGRIWYGEGSVLVCIDKSGRTVFGKESGMNTGSFLNGCALSSDNGKLLFGGVNGIDSFSPDNVLKNASDNHDRIIITDVLIDGVSVGVSDEVKVNSGAKRVVILFSNLSFKSSDIIDYSFYMKGEDSGWRHDSSVATYEHLSPGSHTFTVKYDGDDEPMETSIEIKVRYPVYARWWAILIYLSILGLSSLAVINFYRRKREEATFREKYNFFTNIIHEIRTPLTLIKTPLERLMGTSGLNEQAKASLGMINKGTDTLINLVNQLLDYRKSEGGYYVLNLRPCLIGALTEEICSRFRPIVESEGKTLDVTIPSEAYSYNVDHEALEKILNNILSNAVKYAVSTINLKLEEFPDHFSIVISNDGEKIATAERENVFKMFYQVKGSKNGTGIGLPLARMLAERHEGSLAIDPNSEMTTFVVRIPGDRSLAQDFEQAENMEKPDEIGMVESSILIIDDNEDLRRMIAEILKDDYKVLQAGNGKEGIDILGKEAVDLVLSDIMMPEMDGYELCEFMKSDPRYSSIPVILLTAKASVEDKIKGLKYGADDYIEKPFSPDLLVTKVHSVIDNREKIKEFYRGLPIVHPSQISKITKSDSDFINKMKAELEKHLSDLDYSLVDLTKDMFMSQSSFYRKVKVLTGVSPNDFVKEFKLQRAAEMLSDGKYLANEVYKEVGFSSFSYFSQCFKKKYGVSPTKYVDSLKKHEEA